MLARLSRFIRRIRPRAYLRLRCDGLRLRMS
jgi:hypothetical protein